MTGDSKPSAEDMDAAIAALSQHGDPLRPYQVEAVAKAIAERVNRETARCAEAVVKMRNQRHAYRIITRNPRAQLPNCEHWATPFIDDMADAAKVAKAVASAREHGCHFAEGTCDECLEISYAAIRACRALAEPMSALGAADPPNTSGER